MKNLNKLSKEDLETRKLVSELRFWPRLFQIPSFWSFIIVVIASIITYQSGVFDVRSKLLAVKTERLEIKKNSLDAQIINLEQGYYRKEQEYDSLLQIIQRINRMKDSIQNLLQIKAVKIQSKKQLSKEVLGFTADIRTMINKWDQKEIEEKKELEKQNKYIYVSYSGDMMREYNTYFKTKAMLYKKKLMIFLPDWKSVKYSTPDYERPTNPIGLNMVVDDLELMAREVAY